MKTLAQSCNTIAQDSDPGSRGRESEALHLSHSALRGSVSNVDITQNDTERKKEHKIILTSDVP